MDECRICLSPAPDRYINQLKTSKKDGSKDHSEILLFCLDIQISDELENKEKVCSNCFTNILSFYKFKLMALKNDAYLKSVDTSPRKPCPYQNSLDTSPETVQAIKDNVLFDLAPIISTDLNEYATDEYDENLDTDDSVQYEDIQHLEDYDLDDDNLDNIQDDVFYDPALKYESKNKAKTIKRNKEINPNTSKKGIATTIVAKARVNMQPKPGICDQCGESAKDIKAHILVHLPKNERQKFPCTDCNKSFFTKSALTRHNKMTHLGKIGYCEICNKHYKELRAHKLAIHNRDQLRFQCTVCHTRFLSITKLDVHMLTHTKHTPFECETCGKKFSQKLVLGTHIRNVHNKEKNFTCKFCQKSFFQKHHLSTHMRTHTKERPYKCHDCGKFFAQTSHLRIHMGTHSTIRVYPCNLCDMTFKAPSTLYLHKKTHRDPEDQELKLKCTHCDMRYKTSINLQRHMQSHTHAQGVLKKQLKSAQKIRTIVLASHY